MEKWNNPGIVTAPSGGLIALAGDAHEDCLGLSPRPPHLQVTGGTWAEELVDYLCLKVFPTASSFIPLLFFLKLFLTFSSFFHDVFGGVLHLSFLLFFYILSIISNFGSAFRIQIPPPPIRPFPEAKQGQTQQCVAACHGGSVRLRPRAMSRERLASSSSSAWD